MAYTNNEYRINVRGTIGSSEIFSNTWAVLDVVGGQSIAEVAPILRGFYADAYLGQVSSHTSAVGATAKNLGTLVQTELSWEEVVGDDLADLLPTQCGIRVSLTGPLGVHGGPFLAGFSVNATDSEGLYNPASAGIVATALEDMVAALEAAGWNLRIDRPTAATTVAVTQARIGQRFDVIRKRANDLAESYIVVTL